MKVLVVGNGGREHALVHALTRSDSVREVFATRPNPGMAELATALDIGPMDLDGIRTAALGLQLDLVVIGPEGPLCAGLADLLRAAGLAVLGPSAAAARLEGSKAFTKEILDEAHIPTAAWGSFTDTDAAIAWARSRANPPVVKADGLMGGKGVVVPDSIAECEAAIRTLGADGGRLLLEDRLLGPEVSIIGLSDGQTVLALPSARDHKRIFDGDRGPNTGGMGAVSPAPGVSDALVEQVRTEVLLPTVQAMNRRGTPFVGFLYAGIMLTPDGPRVLEFNARMGDPEAQVVLSRLSGDLGLLFHRAATGELAGATLPVDPRPAVCVVMATRGYPDAPVSGQLIAGLEDAARVEDVVVFHAGTTASPEGIRTSGGRVLGVTGRGATTDAARHAAYEAVAQIHFEGAQARRDIAGTNQ